MTTPANLVRFQQDGQTATFKVIGRATMHLGPPLRRQAEACLAGGTRWINVDLRDCTYMDSTFLGTLIVLHKQTAEREGRFTLVAPSPSCSKTLRQMGLDDYLHEQAEGASPETGWTDLPATVTDVSALRHTVEMAHRELAGLPGEAGQQFQEALRCINRAAPPAPPASDPPRND